MSHLVILPRKPLAELNGVQNGLIPGERLVSVGGGNGRLLNTPARSWNALYWIMAGKGLPLTWTWGGTYRTFLQQYELFHRRYRPTNAAVYYATRSSRRKYWGGGPYFGESRYWVKIKNANGSYPATAATPGSSNHGLAIAVDTAYDGNPSNGVSPHDARAITGHLAWPNFKAQVLACGWSWELQSEPWHIRYVHGNGVPPIVTAVEAFMGYTWKDGVGPVGVSKPPPPPPPPPVPTKNWTELLMDTLPNVKPGSTGVWVKKVQGLILANGGYVAMDGYYGDQTVNNVKGFQRAKGLTADGWVGKNTWSALIGA